MDPSTLGLSTKGLAVNDLTDRNNKADDGFCEGCVFDKEGKAVCVFPADGKCVMVEDIAETQWV